MNNPNPREIPSSRIEELLFQTITQRLGDDMPYYQVTIEAQGRRLVYDVTLNIEETLKH